MELGASDADVGAPPAARSAPTDSGAAASAVEAVAAAVADVAQAGGSSAPGTHGRPGRGVAAVAAAVAAANGGVASDQQHRHATTLRATGGGGGGGSSRIGPGPSSYAAAAAAGTGPGAEPKLRFSLNGRRLPHGFTILQAVQQAKADAATADAAAASAAAAGVNSAGSGAGGSNALALDAAQAARRARRLWDEVRSHRRGRTEAIRADQSCHARTSCLVRVPCRSIEVLLWEGSWPSEGWAFCSCVAKYVGGSILSMSEQFCCGHTLQMVMCSAV